MGNNNPPERPLHRVDARAKVTGAATYAADHRLPGLAYGVLVGSTVARGRIQQLDTKAAERAAGVLAVLTYRNAPKAPGYQPAAPTAEAASADQPLRIFYDPEIWYYDQPIALVVADTYEQARHAASLVRAEYEKAAHVTNLKAALSQARTPGDRDSKDYARGDAEAWKNADVVIEAAYEQPLEVHNPMETSAIVAHWEAPDRLRVYTKTQGVEDTRQAIHEAFLLPKENIHVHAEYIGGAFGVALRTWPYEIAAMLGAQQTGRPVKIVLSREQMFTNVGSRPGAVQTIGLGATRDGVLTGMYHEATGHTSDYETFTEGVPAVSKFLYACPNVSTRYRVAPLATCTPVWMRGPGEATGAFALESAMDELAHALGLDPLELRRRNHADVNPENNKPWSSKNVLECYVRGAKKIGWYNRRQEPGTLREGDWLVGYGMGTGAFGAFRWGATVRATLTAEGTLTVQCSVNDMGPGTSTMMTKIAADTLGVPANRVHIELGRTGLPPGPTQGGSATTANVGSAVYEACTQLKDQLTELAGRLGSAFLRGGAAPATSDLVFANGELTLAADTAVKMSYGALLQQQGLFNLEILHESKGSDARRQYAMYSFSVHFVKLRVHARTGQVRVDHVVSCADAGAIISYQTAESQIIGGVVGGIGMALTEGLVFDHRYGRPINNTFADYHIPVNADIPPVDVILIDKKDAHTNPMGSKGLGEIALIGVAPAVVNAVFNATGKRVRALPVTVDKLI